MRLPDEVLVVFQLRIGSTALQPSRQYDHLVITANYFGPKHRGPYEKDSVNAAT